MLALKSIVANGIILRVLSRNGGLFEDVRRTGAWPRLLKKNQSFVFKHALPPGFWSLIGADIVFWFI